MAPIKKKKERFNIFLVMYVLVMVFCIASPRSIDSGYHYLPSSPVHLTTAPYSLCCESLVSYILTVHVPHVQYFYVLIIFISIICYPF
jgi:hypothetical protein